MLHQAPQNGLTLYAAPSGRQRLARRRALGIGVVMAIALAGALIGQLSQRRDAAHPIPPGPFSYFPT